MRTFVAIFPPLAVRMATLTRAREIVRQSSGDHPGNRLRWARPENVHLTLKFLGDIREEALEDLRALLGEACAGRRSFDVGLLGLGAFPSARHARILWAGVGAGSEELRSLAADLDAAFAPLGFEREKRSYNPHLTLGRIRGRPASLDLSSPETRELRFRAQRVELVKSTLTSEGAVYKTIETFALGRFAPGSRE